MTRSVFTLAAACTTASLLLAGCGSATGHTQAGGSSASPSATPTPSVDPQAQAAYAACASAVQQLRTALGQVNSRLDVGLNYQDYGNRVGDAKVAYDGAVPRVKSAGDACLDVGLPLQNALNAYVTVQNAWGKCLDDYNCDFSKGDANAKAQAGWKRAGKALANSDRKLAAMRP